MGKHVDETKYLLEKNANQVDEGERSLMARALAENSVIVAQVTPFYDDDEAEDDED